MEDEIVEEKLENEESKDDLDNLESNKPKKSLKKNYIFNLIYQVFVLIVPLITAPYISRILSAEGVGQYSFTNSIQNYFTIVAALGFGYYAQRLIAFHQNNKDEQSKIFWEIIIVRSLSVGFAVLLNLILFFSGVYQEYNQLMIWWTLNIVAVGFDITFLLQGNEDFGKIVGRNVIIKIISVTLIFVLVKKQTDVWLYVILTSCANLIGNISLWLYLPKYLNKVSRKDLKPFRHFLPTVKLFIPTIATSVYTILDKTLIGLLINETYTVQETQVINGVETTVDVIKKYSDLENGYYEQSEKIVKMCIAVMTALGTVMIPRNSKLYKEGKTEELKKNFYFAVNFVWTIGIPMMFGLAAVSSNIIPWFLGDGYDKCIRLMQIFTPLIIFIGLSNVFGLQYLIPTGRDKKFTIGILAGTISNLILNCILIPFFWANGAVIASLVAEFLVTFTMYLLIRKEVSLKEILKSAIKPLIAGILMFALIYFLSTKFSPSILHTLLLVMIGAVTYFVLLLIMKERLLYMGINMLKSKFRGGENQVLENNSNDLITQTSKVKKVRQSGIELLKIIGIFLIIISHTIQTLRGSTYWQITGDWILNFAQSSTNISNVILSIFNYAGAIGNAIFFIASAWFLLDNEKSNKRKLLQILLDAFMISVMFLIIIGCTYGLDNIPKKTIIKQFMPIYFSNNWYITFYILFCLLVPFINLVIKSINKKTHLIISIVFFTGYLVAGAIVTFPFYSQLILWSGIYIIVAYFKMYGINFCKSTKINLVLAFGGILLNAIYVIAVNYIGLNINLFADKLLMFSQNTSCINFLIGFGLFNLFMKFQFKSKLINYISSLSLFIYIIHDNYLFRGYIRPLIWEWIYSTLEYSFVVAWALLLALVLFVVSIILSIIYKETIRRIITKIANVIYMILCSICNKIVEFFDEKIN